MNKQERDHLDKVAALGCIVCRNIGLGWHPAMIHHLRYGRGLSQRSDHFKTLPLCGTHHQHGGFGVAFHAGPRQFQKNFGTEIELLDQVKSLLEMGAEG